MTSASFWKKADAVITKTMQPAKKSARDIRITDILILAVRDNDLRTVFRKLKGKDAEQKQDSIGKGTNWDIDNATKDKYNVTRNSN